MHLSMSCYQHPPRKTTCFLALPILISQPSEIQMFLDPIESGSIQKNNGWMHKNNLRTTELKNIYIVKLDHSPQNEVENEKSLKTPSTWNCSLKEKKNNHFSPTGNWPSRSVNRFFPSHSAKFFSAKFKKKLPWDVGESHFGPHPPVPNFGGRNRGLILAQTHYGDTLCKTCCKNPVLGAVRESLLASQKKTISKPAKETSLPANVVANVCRIYLIPEFFVQKIHFLGVQTVQNPLHTMQKKTSSQGWSDIYIYIYYQYNPRVSLKRTISR